MNIPSKIVKSDSTSWVDCATQDVLGNAVTSADWTLTYALRGATTLDLTAVAEGDGWKTSISAAQSGGLTAGIYYWQAIVTKGSERITLGSGQITVEADLLAASTGFDGRSQARKDLDAVQAAIRAIISGGAVAEYTIGNRSVRKMGMESLIMLESKLKAEVVREEKAQAIANGLGDPNNLFVRFGR